MGISFRYMPCQVPSFWRQIQQIKEGTHSMETTKDESEPCGTIPELQCC